MLGNHPGTAREPLHIRTQGFYCPVSSSSLLTEDGPATHSERRRRLWKTYGEDPMQHSLLIFAKSASEEEGDDSILTGRQAPLLNLG